MYYYRLNKLCIKLVIETNLHYEARSEKHQIKVTVDLRLVKPCWQRLNLKFT